MRRDRHGEEAAHGQVKFEDHWSRRCHLGTGEEDEGLSHEFPNSARLGRGQRASITEV